METDMITDVAILKTKVGTLEQNYGQLSRDVANLRDDISGIKDDMSDIKHDNEAHFSDLRELIIKMSGKALQSLPPWGAVLTILLGGMIGAVVSFVLAHFGG
ncbi:hypothetical protein [Sporolactobacillus pectinivorans]|uniref:hypothetical protein n=1 Tax=Sporolactobacillus pectinivorans TaxID=1591408 RepID=UPI000C25B6B0|nr:hypothetical protein [Sporolactobacillus pectinivorans]